VTEQKEMSSYIKNLEAENKQLTDELKEQEAHIESLQNTVAQVTTENIALGEYVDADIENQNTIKKLEAENERLDPQGARTMSDAEELIDALAKCCTQRGARMQIMREILTAQVGPSIEDGDYYPEIASWFDEDGVPVDTAGVNERLVRRGGL